MCLLCHATAFANELVENTSNSTNAQSTETLMVTTIPGGTPQKTGYFYVPSSGTKNYTLKFTGPALATITFKVYRGNSNTPAWTGSASSNSSITATKNFSSGEYRIVLTSTSNQDILCVLTCS